MRHMRCIVRLIDKYKLAIDIIALINMQDRREIVETGQINPVYLLFMYIYNTYEITPSKTSAIARFKFGNG